MPGTWQDRADRVRESLFFVPALYVVGAVALAELALRVDAAMAARGARLPFMPPSTVESARVLLSTIAGATMTVAGVVFAVTVVSIQLASSQFSPRVIPQFLRDRLQQQVTGFVVGTFTYCLLILASVRAPDAAEPAGAVPHTSVALAVALGVGAILGIVAYIDHSARSMQVGEIIRRVTEETCRRIDDLYPRAPGPSRGAALVEASLPAAPPAHVVAATGRGWVRHIDTVTLLGLLPPGGTLRLDVRNGTFVMPGTPLCGVWPAPADRAAFDLQARDAILLGAARTLLADVAFGIRQLVDIGLRALSPGVNDPTTAYDVIVHVGTVLQELLTRDLAPVLRSEGDRRLVAASDLSHDDYVDRALDQLRVAGASHPSVALAIVGMLGRLAGSLEAAGAADRVAPLRRQAALVLAGCAAAHPLPEDLARVQAAAEQAGLRPRP